MFGTLKDTSTTAGLLLERIVQELWWTGGTGCRHHRVLLFKKVVRLERLMPMLSPTTTMAWVS